MFVELHIGHTDFGYSEGALYPDGLSAPFGNYIAPLACACDLYLRGVVLVWDNLTIVVCSFLELRHTPQLLHPTVNDKNYNPKGRHLLKNLMPKKLVAFFKSITTVV